MNDEAIYTARLELIDFLIEAFWDAPTEAFVADLIEGEVELPEESVTPEMDEGFAMLESWIERNRGEDVADVRDELEREYTRLFVGPRPPVLPHETYYREDTDFIGDGLVAVEESYAAVGWEPPEEYPEEADFVAVELAFLRHLVDRQRRGEEEAFGFERVFLDEHLLEWADAFVDDVREKADPGLFLAASLAFGGLVTFEDELVAQMVPG
ncbi:molecular chaperone TorD family protein [Halorussus salilacus]|uniref:TorD/DmsD family molecular chaperone n=1 Tax=Halorussus salilacus TaxID=2953750 RepID=UPI00209DAF36|nr:molecular chaperone TorD family protein [Halorussus salilacus]USZ66906.1 molecular chaperone TorD family protein [Halorussus salilacus]